MPKRTRAIIPPAPTAPGGEVKPLPHADSPVVLATSDEFRAETPTLGASSAPQPELRTIFKGEASPDTVSRIAAALVGTGTPPIDEAEAKHLAALKAPSLWRCPHDGQMNASTKRCTTCGTERK